MLNLKALAVSLAPLGLGGLGLPAAPIPVLHAPVLSVAAQPSLPTAQAFLVAPAPAASLALPKPAPRAAAFAHPAAAAEAGDALPAARFPQARAALKALGRLARGDGRLNDPMFDGALAPRPAVGTPAEHQARRDAAVTAQKVRFAGIGDRDVYNPTAPFETEFRGKKVSVLAARVEPRESEASEVVFFQKSRGGWRPLPGAPVLKLQDPFVSKVGAELVVGGVQTFPREGGGLGYRTVFYRGTSLSGLKPFAKGPDGMKDIRLAPLPDGRLLVLTRPQGAVGGRGKIAMTVLDGLSALGPETIARAALFEGLFDEDEWGGANELHLLGNGLVGVLGHVARFDAAGDRHYYPMAFAFDPATGRRTSMKVLLERAQLPPGASKRPDLADVLFSGGLVRGPDGTAALYVGAGDAEVYRVDIPDPFLEFELLSPPTRG